MLSYDREESDVSAKTYHANYDVIRCFAFTLVLLQHFFVECSRAGIVIPQYAAWLIGGVITMGNVGSALFFLLSGSLLWLNHKKDNWKSFYKNQLPKLYLPIWVSYLFFSIVYYAKKGVLWDTSVGQIIFPLLGGNHFVEPIYNKFGYIPLNLVGEWFTSVILILYIVYPILKWMFKSKFRIFFTIIIFVIFFANFHYPILLYQDGHISITIGFFYFWIGMYCEEYKDRIAKVWIAVPVFLIMILVWAVKPSNLFGFLYGPNIIVILSLYISSYLLKTCPKGLRWICKHSYIVYLVHHTIMVWLIPVIGAATMGDLRIYLMLISIIALIFAIGIMEEKLCENIFKKIRAMISISKAER